VVFYCETFGNASANLSGTTNDDLHSDSRITCCWKCKLISRDIGPTRRQKQDG